MDARFELDFECQESWEEMRELAPGERRCDRCSENVVDLSRMTRKRALEVVGQAAPPCISYLVRGDEPVFARPVVRGGLLAAAAGLLAACSAPEEVCELSPEPTEAEVSLLDPMSTGFGGSLSTPGAPMPAATAVPVIAQNGGASDAAEPGDPNDLDGAPSSSHATPAAAPPPIHRLRGRVRPSYHRPPVGTTPGDRNDL